MVAVKPTNSFILLSKERFGKGEIVEEPVMFKIQGWVERGNTTITTGGLNSSNTAQGSFPGATVTVYIHGISPPTLASLFSDNNASPTPLANPFTANVDGSFGFYAETGRYDIVFSGGSLPAPYTISDVTNGAGGGSGDVVGPLSAVDGNLAVFDGTSGMLIKDGGPSPDLSSVIAGIVQGRLTLAPGFPVYVPQAATPASTNTSTDIVTFAADPGWPTGTILTPATTTGGLATGTRYFFGRLSALTGAFYTSVANANSNTSKVDLTGNITQQLNPSGISQTSVNFSPYNGNAIGLFSGTAWILRTFVETNIPLGTLTSGLPYDVFCYDNSGTAAFELLAWTNGTTRATAIALQNGIPVKFGATTRRLVGTIYTDSTTTTIDDAGGLTSQVGGKRFVANLYNQVRSPLREFDGTTTWTYNTATWRQANGATGNKVEFVCCLPIAISMDLNAIGSNSNASTTSLATGLNLDSILATPFISMPVNTTNQTVGMSSRLDMIVPPGYHFVAWMETGNGAATSTFTGQGSSTIQHSGLIGSVPS